jgi:hypothetical protein
MSIECGQCDTARSIPTVTSSSLFCESDARSCSDGVVRETHFLFDSGNSLCIIFSGHYHANQITVIRLVTVYLNFCAVTADLAQN